MEIVPQPPPMAVWLTQNLRAKALERSLSKEVIEWMTANLTGSYEIIRCSVSWAPQYRYALQFELERDLVLFKLWWL